MRVSMSAALVQPPERGKLPAALRKLKVGGSLLVEGAMHHQIAPTVLRVLGAGNYSTVTEAPGKVRVWRIK